jgi:hypothetical protein
MSSHSLDFEPSIDFSSSSDSVHLRTQLEGTESSEPFDSTYAQHPQLTASRDGVYTPPPEMASSQLDSLPHNHLPYKSNSHIPNKPRTHFPGISFNDLSYSISTQPDSRTKPPRSPTPSPVWTTRAEAENMGNDARSEGSNSTLIAASMQIPLSINNSRGSLAEFAAQVG